MMKYWILSLSCVLLLSFSVSAGGQNSPTRDIQTLGGAVVNVSQTAPSAEAPTATVKLINFTADWCPNCQRLNPRIDSAITILNTAKVERIDLDLTKTKRSSETQYQETVEAAVALATEHKADYLWMWYGGFTGIGVIIAADSGEPISCLIGDMSVKDIKDRFDEALYLTANFPEGGRKPKGPDCPPPLR